MSNFISERHFAVILLLSLFQSFQNFQKLLLTMQLERVSVMSQRAPFFQLCLGQKILTKLLKKFSHR